MTLGEKLKALRRARGWTQRELGQRAHVRQALISDLERTKQLDTKSQILRRLADALGVALEELLGPYEGPPAPPASPGEEWSLVGVAPPPAPISVVGVSV